MLLLLKIKPPTFLWGEAKTQILGHEVPVAACQVQIIADVCKMLKQLAMLTLYNIVLIFSH